MGFATGAAMLGSAAIGAFGASKAADAQKDAAKYAARIERKRLDRLMPFVDAGKGSIAEFRAGLNFTPDFEALANDPSYQFELEQGMNAIQGSAAAQGLLRSGRTLKDLVGFSQGIASQGIDKQYGRNVDRQNQLLSLMQLGANAGGAQSNLSQIALQAGQAQADKYMNYANIGTNALQNLLLASQLGGGGGGGGGAPYAGGTMMPGVGGYA